ITGTWVTDPDAREAMKFNRDGTFELIDRTNNNEKILQNMTVTYRTLLKDGISIIEFSYYRNNVIIGKEGVKYKLIDDQLYLPREHIINGVKSVTDYKDIYIRVK